LGNGSYVSFTFCKMPTGKGNGIEVKRTSLFWSLMTAIAVMVAVFAYTGTAESATPTGSISGTVTEDDGSTPVVGGVIFVSDFTTGAAAGSRL
jgi:hypothetical protein